MAEDFFDLSGFDDNTWKDLENPSPLPAGWYRARLKDVDTDTATGNLFLHFQVATGPFQGKVVKDTLWNPTNSEDESKQKITRNRRILFASRLGLITEADKKRNDPNFRVIWDNAINTEVYIKVDQRIYDKKDKNGKATGEKGIGNQLTFDGVFALTDEKVPLEVRQGRMSDAGTSPTSPASPSTSARPSAPATPPKKPNLDDLM